MSMSKVKIRRRISVLLTAMLCLSVIGILLIDFRVDSFGRKLVRESDEITGGYDCIIVPGASVIANKYPSDILRDRLDTAFEVYKQTGIKRILVSGDHGTVEYDEVNVMRDYLIAKGVPAEDVFMDHAGFDTYQTMFRARDIFEIRSAVIATQDFHLYRALYIADSLGLNVVGADSALREYKYSTRNRLREFPARVKAFIECNITKPDPRFLGDKIPINGENLTIDRK
jgi:vancomycin permeability regulator SanA